MTLVRGQKDVANYRPVSVLPVIVKLFEQLVHKRVYNYPQQQGVLDLAQFGFRPDHSTQDALVSMVEEWGESIITSWLVSLH